MKTRLLLMGACVAGLNGCNAGNQPTNRSQNSVSVQSGSPEIEPTATPHRATETAVTDDALPVPPAEVEAKVARDAVTERARRYAMAMEATMAARDVRPVAQPSQVDWAQLLGTDDSAPPAVAPAVPAPAIEPAVEDPVVVPKPVAQPVALKKAPVARTPVAVQPEADTSTANAGINIDGQTDSGPMVVPEGQEIAVFTPIVPFENRSAVTTPPARPPSPAPSPTVVAPETVAALPEAPPRAAGSTDVLSKRIAENPRDIAAHLDYQLAQFAQGKSVPELTALAPLPVEDREVIAAVMDGLSNFRASVQADGNQLLSKKVRPLVDMTERLKASADLSVPTIALCRRVNGFGVYEPIEPADFPRGRETPVILYCEVANFSSHKADGKQWQTELSHSATLYRDSGVPVWSDKTTNVIDHSRNRRSDFFVVKMLRLPATLTPGRYVLKVSVVDRQSNRMAEASTTLTIGSGENMAKTEQGPIMP